MKLANVQTSDAGLYTCTASNLMTPTESPAVKGEDTNVFTLTVLYAPKASSIQDRYLVELSSLNVSCESIPGDPPETAYIWTRSTDKWSQESDTMTIASVKRTDSASYTCTAWNIMKTTVGTQQRGEDSTTFALNVLFAPRSSVDEVPNIVVHKSRGDDVSLRLSVIAYPMPDFTWFVANKCSESGWSEILSGVSSSNHSSTMTIKNLDSAGFGQYRVIVSNGISPDFIQLYTLNEQEIRSGELVQTRDLTSTYVLVGASVASVVFGIGVTLSTLCLLNKLGIVTTKRRSSYIQNARSSPKQPGQSNTESGADIRETHKEEEMHEYEGLADRNPSAQAYESLETGSPDAPDMHEYEGLADMDPSGHAYESVHTGSTQVPVTMTKGNDNETYLNISV